MQDSEDEETAARMERLAAHKRYNMKSLGRLVESNRLTGVARPAPRRPLVPDDPPPPSPGAEAVDADVDQVGAPPVAPAPTDPGAPDGPDAVPAEQPLDLSDRATVEPGAVSASVSDGPVPDGPVPDGPVPVGVGRTADTDSTRAEQTVVEPASAEPPAFATALSDAPPSVGPSRRSRVAAPSARAVVASPRTSTDRTATPGVVDDPLGHDGVDRSSMGGTVTRTGLPDLVGRTSVTPPEDETAVTDARALARKMLDGEIGPGGHISDPRDVSGIVLELAKDVPAAVAVSVVRIDEEVEVVGDTIDPMIDPSVFSSVFSGVFRSVRPAAQVLEEGPLGPIQDVVIEGEKMDLVLRPLGDRYYLMLLENRADPRANLPTARMRMSSIAPAITAILTQQDGES